MNILLKIFKRFNNSTKNIFNLVFGVINYTSTQKQIKNLYSLKQDVDLVNEISLKEKQFWINYSQSMNKKSNYATLYLSIILFWIIANIFLAKNISMTVTLVQIYFFAILAYYFIICKYRSYQGLSRANNIKELSLKQWLKQVINKKT